MGWIRVDRPAAEIHGENVDSVGLHLMRAILDFNDVLFGYQGSVWTRRGWEPRKIWVSVGNERGAFHGTHWKHRTAPASWEPKSARAGGELGPTNISAREKYYM